LTLGTEPPAAEAAGSAPARVVLLFQSMLDRVNAVLIAFSAVAVGAAGCVLTWEVAGRYFFKLPSLWQDELSVLLLVSATFFSASWIQTHRGHVAVDLLHHVLPAAIDHVRVIVTEFLTFAFCAFFCWKCWTLLYEAIDEGQTSNSPWGPPLWIPYGSMAVGMTLLAVQVLLQFATQLVAAKKQ
jgi:TRAP-type C4-dicarboxylate transport system permease small subunit